MDQLTSVQLSEWEAYDTLDPIGTWRQDFNAAQICSLMINIVNNLYHKEGEEPVQTNPTDFMPIWDAKARKSLAETKKPKQSVESMLNFMHSLAITQNKKEARKEELKNHKPPKRQ